MTFRLQPLLFASCRKYYSQFRCIALLIKFIDHVLPAIWSS